MEYVRQKGKENTVYNELMKQFNINTYQLMSDTV